MGIRIIAGTKINECDKPAAVFYDSCSGRVFGPIMADAEEAEAFQHWLASGEIAGLRDPRTMDHDVTCHMLASFRRGRSDWEAQQERVKWAHLDEEEEQAAQ